MLINMKPIIALATSPIKSAIHMIRISGDNCFNIVNKFFSINILKDKKRTVHVGCIKNNNKLIDQVVVITYKNPHSYTGEDSIEIMTHGNILIDKEIISLFIKNGMRMATNGEFTMRAYLNKKIDIIQAEAINDLINATTNEAKNIITYALNGETSKLIKPIKTQILDLISNIEVNIDYPEYKDIEVVTYKKINKELKDIKNKIDKLIINGEQGLIIKEGIKVAIIGKPNVGKSTLLNALIKEDKAIVTNIPGTTRDIVEGDLQIGGIPIHLLDTAGIRLSKNKIESIGVNKTLKAIKDADLIIYVKDKVNNEKIVNLNNKNVIEVINKSDLIKNKDNKHLYISAKKKNINALITKIKKVVGISDVAFNHPCLANARELALLKRINKSIDETLIELKKKTPLDLLMVHIDEILNLILEILGESNTTDLSKEIFSRFCVGK